MTEKLAGQEVSSASLMQREAQSLREAFQKLYAQEARIFRAPGRVNLIGEHTDYNEGFVMPVAMDLYTWVAAAARKDARVHVFSQNLRERAEMDLQHLNLQVQRHWSAYVLGVAASLRISGAEIGGANLLVEGKVPMGAGLSSSASVEVAAGYALLESSGLSRSPVELAKICQRAENEFAGARCGIMDQMIACCGRANYALLLDCRTLGFRLLPLFADAQFVVCNSMVKHDHAAGEYNARRADCETATRILAEQMPGVRALRDVSLADLERYAKLLPEVVYRRSRHVISENARVLAAREALERGDPESFGQLDARIASQPEGRLRSEQHGAGLAGGNCRRNRGRVRLAHDGRRIRRLHHQPGAQRSRGRISKRRRARLPTSDRPQAGHLHRARLRRRARNPRITTRTGLISLLLTSRERLELVERAGPVRSQ